jgi:hypothetical protein
MIMLYFIYCLSLFIIEDRSWLRARAISIQTKTVSRHAYVIRSVMLYFAL